MYASDKTNDFNPMLCMTHTEWERKLNFLYRFHTLPPFVSLLLSFFLFQLCIRTRKFSRTPNLKWISFPFSFFVAQSKLHLAYGHLIPAVKTNCQLRNDKVPFTCTVVHIKKKNCRCTLISCSSFCSICLLVRISCIVNGADPIVRND